jgi:hypothetical protein
MEYRIHLNLQPGEPLEGGIIHAERVWAEYGFEK